MTWTKLDDKFADDCENYELSDAAFRLHIEGLVWSMRRENGGRLSKRDLDRCSGTSEPRAAADELVMVGYWIQLPDEQGWQIEHNLRDQPEPEVLAARRASSTVRQRRKRMRDAGLPDDPNDPPPSRRDKHRDDHRDDPRDPGRVGSGRNGTGKDALYETNNVTGEAEADRNYDDVPASPAPCPDDDHTDHSDTAEEVPRDPSPFRRRFSA